MPEDVIYFKSDVEFSENLQKKLLQMMTLPENYNIKLNKQAELIKKEVIFTITSRDLTDFQYGGAIQTSFRITK